MKLTNQQKAHLEAIRSNLSVGNLTAARNQAADFERKHPITYNINPKLKTWFELIVDADQAHSVACAYVGKIKG